MHHLPTLLSVHTGIHTNSTYWKLRVVTECHGLTSPQPSSASKSQFTTSPWKVNAVWAKMENPTPATQSPAPNLKSPIIMDSGVTKSCWQLRMVTERHELTSQQPPSASHSQFQTPPCRVDAVCAKITHPRPATQSPAPTAKSPIVMDSGVAKLCCQLRVVTTRHGLTSPQPPSASHYQFPTPLCRVNAVCAKITHPTQAAQSPSPVPKSSIVMNSSVAKSWCALPPEPLKRDEKSPQLAGKSRIVVASDQAKSCCTCTFIGQPCVSKQSRYGCDHCMKIG